jgi:hypothetical protein
MSTEGHFGFVAVLPGGNFRAHCTNLRCTFSGHETEDRDIARSEARQHSALGAGQTGEMPLSPTLP